MTSITRPSNMPIESTAIPSQLFIQGMTDRRRGKRVNECPYDITFNQERWAEGWRFQDGAIQSDEAIISYRRATGKEDWMK